MNKPKKLGRPPREGGPAKTRTYRATDDDFSVIEGAAAAKNKPTAVWTLETLLRAARATKRKR